MLTFVIDKALRQRQQSTAIRRHQRLQEHNTRNETHIKSIAIHTLRAPHFELARRVALEAIVRVVRQLRREPRQLVNSIR